MKRIGLWFIIGAFVLSACGPSAADIQQAIEQTQAAAPTSTSVPTNTPIPPTPTSTPIPLSEIDIRSLLVLEGDLPAGYSPAQIRTDVGKDHETLNSAVQNIYQQFEYKGEPGGFVQVYLFDTDDGATKAFEYYQSDTDEDEPVEDLGEVAYGYSISFEVLGTSYKGTYAAFTRCAAFVLLDFEHMTNLSSVIAYGKNLDARLAEVVCR